MKTYSYKVIDTGATGVPLAEPPPSRTKARGRDQPTYGERLEEGLNQLGKEGWQLANVNGPLMIFTRED